MKLLSKKTDIYYKAYVKATEALRASEECCLQIQTQLHHRDQDIKDRTAVKDNKYALYSFYSIYIKYVVYEYMHLFLCVVTC